MKTMRKLFALILALTMVFAMASVVSAAGTAPKAMTNTGTITIKGAASGTQYTIYRIYDIAQVTEDSGDKRNVYITNEKWESFSEEEQNKHRIILSNGYVKSLELPDGTESAAAAQTFAENVVKWAEDHNIEPDGKSAILTTSGDYVSGQYQYGYYVMVSSRESDNPKYSVFALDSSNVNVSEKNVKSASIEKFVQEDSDIGNTDQGWGESNAAEIGQDVHFKVVFTAAAGTDSYTITDTMENFESISDIDVYYSRGHVPENGLTVTKTTAPVGFTVTFGPTFRGLLEDGDTITFTYTAKLKPTATIASTGNINKVVLKSGDTEIASDSTTTYTYKLDVTKHDENGQALAGATFTLSHKGENLKFKQEAGTTNYILTPNGEVGTDGVVNTITTDDSGKFSISGLDTEDEYILTETAAPSGYVLMEPVTIKIAHSDTSTHAVTVVNLPGVEMPETGGMGTTLFYVLGGILVCAAAVLLVTKKRMGTAK